MRLDREIDTATRDLAAARERLGHGFLDAQIDIIVEGTGIPEPKVRLGLLFLVAFVMQLGAAFGVALGLAPLQTHLERRKQERFMKPAPGSHMMWGDGRVGEELTTGPKGPPARNADDGVSQNQPQRTDPRRSRRRIH
jgi:hypothetical protein